MDIVSATFWHENAKSTLLFHENYQFFSFFPGAIRVKQGQYSSFRFFPQQPVHQAASSLRCRLLLMPKSRKNASMGRIESQIFPPIKATTSVLCVCEGFINKENVNCSKNAFFPRVSFSTKWRAWELYIKGLLALCPN